MKPGSVGGLDRRLAERLDTTRRPSGSTLVGGGLAAHELDERHERHGIHEVHAEHAVRPRRSPRQARDRNRRRVRREDDVGPDERVERCEAARASRPGLRRSPRRRSRRDASASIDAAGSHSRPSVASRSAAVSVPFSTNFARLRSIVCRARSIAAVGRVVEQHVVAGLREDLGDAAAHRAGADDADGRESISDGPVVTAIISTPAPRRCRRRDTGSRCRVTCRSRRSA